MTIPLNLPATLDAWQDRDVLLCTTDGSHRAGRIDAVIHASQHDRTIVALYFRFDNTGRPIIVPWHAIAGIESITVPAAERSDTDTDTDTAIVAGPAPRLPDRPELRPRSLAEALAKVGSAGPTFSEAVDALRNIRGVTADELDTWAHQQDRTR